MIILQSGSFWRKVKRLHKAEKHALDRAVKKIAASPNTGALKRGDLAGVRVFKFKVKAQQYLLAYTHDDNLDVINFLGVGPHENFYRDLGR